MDEIIKKHIRKHFSKNKLKRYNIFSKSRFKNNIEENEIFDSQFLFELQDVISQELSIELNEDDLFYHLIDLASEESMGFVDENFEYDEYFMCPLCK